MTLSCYYVPKEIVAAVFYGLPDNFIDDLHNQFENRVILYLKESGFSSVKPIQAIPRPVLRSVLENLSI